MKKIQVSNKLRLGKQTVYHLSVEEANSVKGGFTYSLSTGAVCQRSHQLTAKNAYDCGAKDKAAELER